MSTATVRTPTAEWRRRDDGSWEPVPHVGRKREPGGGGPGPGGSFGPEDVQGGDNIIITELPDGVLIERGGHRVLYEGIPTNWRRDLDFQGSGVSVVDDADNARTIVTVGSHVPGMAWRDEYDPDALYSAGEVVSFGDGLFIFTGGAQGFGFGFGDFGDGPFGGSGSATGFGLDPFGEGPFGG